MKRAGAKREGAKREGAPATVQVLDRAIHLLDIIAEADGLSLTQIAQRAEIATSTAHRLLMTLEAHGLLRQESGRGLWLIGVRTFQIGNAFLRNRKVAEMARPVMRDLMEAVGETVNLAVMDEGAPVFIAQVECHNPLRAFHRPGARTSVTASAVGKVFLAGMPASERNALLSREALVRYTEQTIVDPDRLLAELDQVAQRGIAFDDEERIAGMRCIGAPIYNENAEVVAAMSVSGPAGRLSDTVMQRVAKNLKAAALETTQSIGGKWPEELAASQSSTA